MKQKIKIFSLLLIFASFAFILSTCSSPIDGEGQGNMSSFTISFRENGRWAYPPDGVSGSPAGAPTIADLEFHVLFLREDFSLAKDFFVNGSDADKGSGNVVLQGSIKYGTYHVRIMVYFE
jgi:hypothetical protein